MQRMKRDDGVVAIIVAIVMVVLLGFGTLVLDVGQLYAERRQLQNGADAAVLSLALDCPTAAGCSTDTSPTGLAAVKADQNANDGAATVTEICGNAPSLAPCSPPADIGPWDCRPVPPALASAKHVQVRTKTRASGGGNLVPPFVARALVPGYTGSTVKACARASWGAPGGMNTSLALTISFCEWDVATGGGTNFAPAPPYPPNPSGSVERRLRLHDPGDPSATPCPAAGHSGFDAPGAFGWLDDLDNNCQTDIDENNEYGANTGVSISGPCKAAFETASSPPYPLTYLPIYDNATGTGAGSTYHLKGFAAFVLTGYRLPGASKKSWLTDTFCGAPATKCLSGFFTKALTPTAGTIGTGPSMGVTVIQMSG